ncbi:MAG: hypothetical protein AAB250_13300, partial [Bdellovibrionota bacterium]
MKKFAMITGMMLAAQVAVAGNEGGGGGKGFVCRNADFSETVYLADTYSLVKSGRLKGLNPDEADSTVAAVAEIVERLYPEKTFKHPLFPAQKVSFAWMMEYKYAGLDWSPKPRVASRPDDHIVNVPKNCTKVQLAYQDLKTGVIEEDFTLTHHMTWIERGFLSLHEVFVGLRNQPGKDTTPIRADVEKYAAILDDPRLQLGQLLQKYLGRPAAPKTPAEWGDQYVRANDCHSRVVGYYNHTPMLDPNGPELANCRKALLLQDSYRAQRIPSLLSVPKVLNCISTRGPKGAGARFSVTRLSQSESRGSRAHR